MKQVKEMTDAEKAAKKIQTPAFMRREKVTLKDLEKAKEKNVSGPEGLAALKKQQGVAEDTNELGYHTRVRRGDFRPSKYGEDEYNYLHDLMNTSGDGSGPMLVTIDDKKIARQIAAMYGGDVEETGLGTYRIVQRRGNSPMGNEMPKLTGVAEGSLNEGQYEMMLRNGQVKKFVAKDDADAKRIAAGHGAKSVIKLKGGVPAGKVMENLDPDTQRLEIDIRNALENGDDYTAKQYAKMAPTPEAKKYLLNIIKQEMYGTEPGQGGVAEGKYDPAKDTFNPETHAAITKDGVDKLIPKSQLAKYKEQGWKERHSLKAFHKNREKQGVAEAGINANPFKPGYHIGNPEDISDLETAFREVDQVMDRAASDDEVVGAIRSFSPQIQQQMKDWAMGKVRHNFSGHPEDNLTGPEAIEQDIHPEAQWAEAVRRAFKQGVAEGVQTTHEDPLVTVHDKMGLHTHANLSVVNNIFGLNVTADQVHQGPVRTKNGHDGRALLIKLSKHHASEVEKDSGLGEDAVEDFLSRGGQIQRGKYHNPRKSEKTDYGSKHIGTGRGGKAQNVSGMSANTRVGNKPVVSVESEQLGEGVRLIGSLGSDDARSAKVFRDVEWNEYVVRFYDNGKYNEEADYHTDDKQDAVDTAKSWVKQGQSVAESYTVRAVNRLQPKLVESIVKGLVRIQDIIEGKKTHKAVTESDRQIIKTMVSESLRSGLDYSDAISSIAEFLTNHKTELEEVGTVAPTAPVKPGTVANTAPTTTTTQSPAKPISQQGVDALAQMLKSAGLSQSQLTQIMSKAKE